MYQTSNKKLGGKALSYLLAFALVITTLACGIGPLTMTASAAGMSTLTATSQIKDVFHDQSEEYLSTIEPEVGENVTFTLRTVKNNVTSVTMYYGTGVSGTSWSENSVTMTKSNSVIASDDTGYYEYWTVTLATNLNNFYYYFKVKNSSYTRYYYSRSFWDGGVSSSKSVSKNNFTSYCWVLWVGHSTPDWAKGASWYSLLPDGFYNANVQNDRVQSGGAYDQPWNMTHNSLQDRYGGDIEGISEKIDYIKNMGFDAIEMNPITQSGQNAGYGSGDYNQIEATYGDVETLQKFLDIAHEKDLKVLQDIALTFVSGGVYNYENNKVSADNPYYELFFDADNGGWEAWGGLSTNLYSSLAKSIIYKDKNYSMIARYTDMGMDAYRFDCGGWLGGHEGTDANDPDKTIYSWYSSGTTHKPVSNSTTTYNIIHDIRLKLKAINPEVMLLSESGGVQNSAFDSQWSLYILEGFSQYVDNNLSLDSLRYRVNNLCINMTRSSALCNQIQCNTHDSSGTKFDSENYYRARGAHLIQFTCVGAPSVFFGEENNWPDNPYTFSGNTGGQGFSYFNWDESAWDMDVRNFYLSMLELRNEYSAVKTGSFMELTDNCDFSNGIYAYARINGEGKVITVVNSNTTSKSVTIDAYKLGAGVGTVLTDWFTGETYTVGSNGQITITCRDGGTILVTGRKTTTHRNGYELDEIGTKNYENAIGVTVDGTDATATYRSTGRVSVGANQSAVIDGVTFDKNGSFTVSGDLYFTPDASCPTGKNYIDYLGMSIGKTYVQKTDTKASGFYRIGGITRPNLQGGETSQSIGAITSSTSDSGSVWCSVFGTSITRGEENKLTFKVEYNNGQYKFSINDAGGSYWIDIKSTVEGTGASYEDFDFCLEFFNKQGSYNVTFDLANVTITGDYELTNSRIKSTASSANFNLKSSSNRTVLGTSDNVSFLNSASYGATTVEGKMEADSGLMIRNSNAADDMAYGINRNQDGTYTVFARTSKGAQTTSLMNLVSSDNEYRVIRDNSNTFSVYNVTTGTKLTNSVVSIPMDYDIKAGAYGVGTANVTVLEVNNSADETLYEDFRTSSAVKGLFNNLSGTNYTVTDNKLTFNNATAYAIAKEDDWTFKSSISYVPANDGEYAGVIARQSDDVFAVAGRRKVGGTVELFAGKASDGKVVTLYHITDPDPTKEIIFQIQRIGTEYSAVYSYDGVNWNALGDAMILNLSEEYAGITVKGTTNAGFSYASFGNAVNDGITVNTPQSPNLPECNYFNSRYTSGANYSALSGNWTRDHSDYSAYVEANGSDDGYVNNAVEGYYQNSTDLAVLSNGKVSYEFRINAVFKIDSGAGYIGYNFGRRTVNTTGAYTMKFNGTSVWVEKNGTSIASYTLPTASNELIFALEYDNGVLAIYEGSNSSPIIATEIDSTVGYGAYVMEGVVGHVNNFGMSSNTRSAYSTIPYGQYTAEGNYVSNNVYTTGTIALRSYALTDYVMRVDLGLKQNVVETTDDGGNVISTDYQYGKVSLPIATYCGDRLLEGNTIHLDYDTDGYLKLMVGTTQKGSLDVGKDGVNVMLVKCNGTVSVYVNGNTTPSFSYTGDEALSGGAINYYAQNVKGTFKNIYINSVTSDPASVNDSAIYSNWADGKAYDLITKSYYTDFSDIEDWFNNFSIACTRGYFLLDKENEYASVEKNPALESGKQTNDNRATYLGSMYTDMILKTRLKTGAGQVSVVIGLRDPNANGSHNTWGSLSFIVTGNSINLCCGSSSGLKTFKSVSNTFSANTWYDVCVVVKGDRVIMYQDGVIVFDYTITAENKELAPICDYGHVWIGTINYDATAVYDYLSVTPFVTAFGGYAASTDIIDDVRVNANGSDVTSTYSTNGSVSATTGNSVSFSKIITSGNAYFGADIERTGTTYTDFTVGYYTQTGSDTKIYVIERITNLSGSSYAEIGTKVMGVEYFFNLNKYGNYGQFYIPMTTASCNISADVTSSGITFGAAGYNVFGREIAFSELGIENFVFEPSIGSNISAVTVSDVQISGNVTPELPVSLEVTAPTKTVYKLGESLDTTGMLVTATYNSGREEDVTSSVSTSYDFTSSGVKTVTVTYKGVQNTFDVTVIKVESIEITAPTKTVYKIGEQLNTAGVTVTATYSNSSEESVALSDCTVTGFDSSAIAASQTVTVTYQGKTDTFTVEIIGVVSINVTAPTKTEYKQGDLLDTTGLYVEAVYSNNSKEDVTSSAILNGFSSETAGNVEVTVYYLTFNSKFTVTILEAKTVVIGDGECADDFVITKGDELPVNVRVGTKFVYGWKNTEGEEVTTYDPEVSITPDYVETQMLNVKFQFGKVTAKSTSMRVVASVDGIENYNNVGWVFSTKNSEPVIGAANVSTRNSNKVYSNIMSAGTKMSAKDVYASSKYIDSSNYLFAFDINNIPRSATTSPIYVRAYVELEDGTIVYGDTKAITIADYDVLLDYDLGDNVVWDED